MVVIENYVICLKDSLSSLNLDGGLLPKVLE